MFPLYSPLPVRSPLTGGPAKPCSLLFSPGQGFTIFSGIYIFIGYNSSRLILVRWFPLRTRCGRKHIGSSFFVPLNSPIPDGILLMSVSSLREALYFPSGAGLLLRGGRFTRWIALYEAQCTWGMLGLSRLRLLRWFYHRHPHLQSSHALNHLLDIVP